MDKVFITHLWCDTCDNVELHQIEYVGVKVAKDHARVIAKTFCCTCYMRNEKQGKQTLYKPMTFPSYTWWFLHNNRDYYGDANYEFR